MAALTDKITSTKNGTNPITTTVASGRSIGGTSISCVALDGWSTSTKVHFITYKKTVAGAIDKTTQCDWTAIVSGTTLGSLTLENGTDAGNDVGDFVEMAPTASWAQDLHDGLTKDHDVNGQHVQLTDTNGVKILGLTPTASAVNQVTVTNSTTGNGPTVSATGSDTNIELDVNSKGNKPVKINSQLPWVYLGSASITTNATATTTNVAVSGLSVTVTVPTWATKVRITVTGAQLGNSSSPVNSDIQIWDGTVGSGTLLSYGRITSAGTNYVAPAYARALITAPAGSSKTYNVGISNVGGVTVTLTATTTAPAVLDVECC